MESSAAVAPKKAKELEQSGDMTPIAGTVEVDIPIDVLWDCFAHPHLWPRWNKCFFWAKNRELVLGKNLIWAFQPIKWWYLYKMPASAKIVELEPQSKVTWEVTVLPGFYALHTYHVREVSEGRTEFGSWEKAMGWNFRLMKGFWKAHFTFVKDESLLGAEHLESVYKKAGELSKQALIQYDV
jgi:hypothetical protein